MVPLQNGETPPIMGTVQPAFTEGSSHAGHTDPGSRHVVLRQCVSRGMETSPLSGAGDLEWLQEGRRRFLHLRRQLPNNFLKGAKWSGSWLAQCSPVCLPSGFSAPTGHQVSQGGQMLGPPGGPTLVEPDVVPRVDTGVVEPSFLSLRWEFLPLPMRVN